MLFPPQQQRHADESLIVAVEAKSRIGLDEDIRTDTHLFKRLRLQTFLPLRPVFPFEVLCAARQVPAVEWKMSRVTSLEE